MNVEVHEGRGRGDIRRAVDDGLGRAADTVAILGEGEMVEAHQRQTEAKEASVQDGTPVDAGEHGVEGQRAEEVPSVQQGTGGQLLSPAQAPRLNANAPVKTMTMGLVPSGSLAFVQTDDGVIGGDLLVGKGLCPGRGFGAEVVTGSAQAIKHMLDVATNKAYAACMGTPTCKQCGQRCEAWPRTVMVAR